VIKRIAIALLAAVVLVLCLPLIHHAIRVWTPAPVVNRDSEAWKARVALIARAKVFVTPAPAIAGLDLSHPSNRGPDPDDLQVRGFSRSVDRRGRPGDAVGEGIRGQGATDRRSAGVSRGGEVRARAGRRP
jgi:hypothetical protein